jgi:uncharacterized membrane protein
MLAHLLAKYHLETLRNLKLEEHYKEQEKIRNLIDENIRKN